MGQITEFDVAHSLRTRFRMANMVTPEAPVFEEPVQEGTGFTNPTCPAHALYNLYYVARQQQGWAEFVWEKLSPTQQLVWQCMADTLYPPKEG